MPSRRKKQVNKNVKFALLVCAIIILIFLGFKLSKFIGIGLNLLTNRNISLKQASAANINILLLGVGGGTHEGPDLTDTIIFANLKPASKSATLISLPRDLWSPEINAKINTAYTFGEEKQKGGGLTLSKAMISKILGQPIDYAVKIDFNGFVKAIDLIGGLDIQVDRTFDDYAYPITGQEEATCGHSETDIASLSAQIASGSATELDAFPCRYEHLHFNQGTQHVNGITALKYVRSRHATGPEGSDFARSKRQAKVITAFKDKLFSAGTIVNPVKVVSIINIIKDSIDTDITEEEYSEFIKLAQQMKGLKIHSSVIDTGNEEQEGLLYNPPIGPQFHNAWVLIPKAGNGNYEEIHQFVTCQLKNCNQPTPTVTSKNK
jgi:LCP family protein required for cell wall assembly